MIAHSRTAKLVAILLAGSAHGALALALMPNDPPTLIEGSGGAAELPAVLCARNAPPRPPPPAAALGPQCLGAAAREAG